MKIDDKNGAPATLGNFHVTASPHFGWYPHFFGCYQHHVLFLVSSASAVTEKCWSMLISNRNFCCGDFQYVLFRYHQNIYIYLKKQIIFTYAHTIPISLGDIQWSMIYVYISVFVLIYQPSVWYSLASEFDYPSKKSNIKYHDLYLYMIYHQSINYTVSFCCFQVSSVFHVLIG